MAVLRAAVAAAACTTAGLRGGDAPAAGRRRRRPPAASWRRRLTCSLRPSRRGMRACRGAGGDAQPVADVEQAARRVAVAHELALARRDRPAGPRRRGARHRWAGLPRVADHRGGAARRDRRDRVGGRGCGGGGGGGGSGGGWFFRPVRRWAHKRRPRQRARHGCCAAGIDGRVEEGHAPPGGGRDEGTNLFLFAPVPNRHACRLPLAPLPPHLPLRVVGGSTRRWRRWLRRRWRRWRQRTCGAGGAGCLHLFLPFYYVKPAAHAEEEAVEPHLGRRLSQSAK